MKQLKVVIKQQKVVLIQLLVVGFICKTPMEQNNFVASIKKIK